MRRTVAQCSPFPAVAALRCEASRDVHCLAGLSFTLPYLYHITARGVNKQASNIFSKYYFAFPTDF